MTDMAKKTKQNAAFAVSNFRSFGMLAYALPGLLVVSVGAFYMYRRQSVQVYFAPNQSFKRTRDKSRAA